MLIKVNALETAPYLASRLMQSVNKAVAAVAANVNAIGNRLTLQSGNSRTSSCSYPQTVTSPDALQFDGPSEVHIEEDMGFVPAETMLGDDGVREPGTSTLAAHNHVDAHDGIFGSVS